MGVRRDIAKNHPGDTPPQSPQGGARATPRTRGRVRPGLHRVVGASQVAAGVALIVVNYIDYSGSSLLPGGHQEAYFLLGILVAASSIWWFGWFDRQPSPEEIRAAYDRTRSSASHGASPPDRSSARSASGSGAVGQKGDRLMRPGSAQPAAKVANARVFAALRTWSVRRRWAAAAAAAVIGVVIAVPTGIIRTSWYSRMTPVLWWNYPVWAASAVLGGLVFASYVREPNRRSVPKTATAGGVLSFLAVGCPICNKLIVAAIGVSGALNVFAPLQPVLGVLSVAVMAVALRQRLIGEIVCPTP